nr:glycosyltransferase [Nesterenkonia sp.]
MPEAEVCVIGAAGDRFAGDLWPMLREADVVITTAGQNSVAETAAARTPALLVPCDRPHLEQAHTADALHRGPWPALRAPLSQDPTRWREALLEAHALDGGDWSLWCGGGAAGRFTDLLQQLRRGQDPADDPAAQSAQHGVGVSICAGSGSTWPAAPPPRQPMWWSPWATRSPARRLPPSPARLFTRCRSMCRPPASCRWSPPAMPAPEQHRRSPEAAPMTSWSSWTWTASPARS